ncbi:unnamed protein product, partial [Discosporangium mesarthrocarpum]
MSTNMRRQGSASSRLVGRIRKSFSLRRSGSTRGSTTNRSNTARDEGADEDNEAIAQNDELQHRTDELEQSLPLAPPSPAEAEGNDAPSHAAPSMPSPPPESETSENRGIELSILVKAGEEPGDVFDDDEPSVADLGSARFAAAVSPDNFIRAGTGEGGDRSGGWHGPSNMHGVTTETAASTRRLHRRRQSPPKSVDGGRTSQGLAAAGLGVGGGGKQRGSRSSRFKHFSRRHSDGDRTPSGGPATPLFA